MRESKTKLLRNGTTSERKLVNRGGTPVRFLLNAALGNGAGRWLAVSTLSGAALLLGCNKGSDSAGTEAQPNAVQSGDKAVGKSTNASGQPGSGFSSETNAALPGVDAVAQFAALTNQFATAQRAQAELIQKLLGRIEQLEKKETDHAVSAQSAQQALKEQDKAHEEQEQKFVGRIKELEGKVGSLQAGRVLPEIAVAAEDGPTARDLEQKIRILERKNELAAEAAEAKAKDAPKLSIGANGFALSSADTNFALRLKGLVQLDSRTFFGDNPHSQGNDGFYLRRARPIIEGTVFRDFDFQFVPDFGGTTVQIFDANLNYRYRPELQLKAGKFKGPVGFENLQADSTLPFNERSLVSNFSPSRNLGVQLWGDVLDGRLGYALGVFNGSGDGRVASNNDFSDDKEFAGKISLQPFKKSGLKALEGLGFGVGASYSQISSNAAALPSTSGGTQPGYLTSGLQQFFAYNPVVGTVVADGAHWRVSPYITYLQGPFGLLGEYAISHQGVLNSLTHRRAELDHTAWEVSAQWVLTGEPASFTGLTPKRSFDPLNGGWGAWQLVGRFGQLDIDDRAFQGFANPDSSASGATSWSVGINWWLNKNVRLLTSFSQTTFTGGGLDTLSLTPPATVTRQSETAFFTRLQLAF